jgi:hypothetical protein
MRERSSRRLTHCASVAAPWISFDLASINLQRRSPHAMGQSSGFFTESFFVIG